MVKYISRAFLFFLFWFFLIAQTFTVFANQDVGDYQATPNSPVANWIAHPPADYQYNHQPFQWKFAHPAPPNSVLPAVWEAGFAWLKQTSNSALEITVFGGGTLYGVKGGFKAIRSSIADFGTCYTAFEAKGFELTKTFQLPYVAPSNPYLTARIIAELMPTRLKKEFQKRGVYPGHIIPLRPLNLMSKKPIRLPTDLRGKKVVSFINAPGAASTLGFSEVRIPFTEIYTALQLGIIDAVIWSDLGFVPFRIYEQAKFYTDIGIAPLTIETCINRKSFDRLPNPLKKKVSTFQQQILAAFIDRMEHFHDYSQATLHQNDVTFIKLNKDQQTAWKNAFAPIVDRSLETCERRGKDCVGLIREIGRLEEKYRNLNDKELMELLLKQPVKGAIDF